MKNENVVIAKVPTTVTVEECVSEKKGTKYKALFATINGVKVRIGFCDVYTENALMKAGIKL